MTNEFEIKGEWFLPSKREERVHGTLNFHPKEGANLELYNSLDSDPFFPEFKDEEIILGLSGKYKGDVQIQQLALLWGTVQSDESKRLNVRIITQTIEYKAEL